MRERLGGRRVLGVLLYTAALYALSLDPVFRMAGQFLGPIPLAVLAVRSGVERSILAGAFMAVAIYSLSLGIAPASAAQHVALFFTVIAAPAWILGYGLRREHHGLRIVLALAAFYLAVSFAEMLAFVRSGDFLLLERGLDELLHSGVPAWIQPAEAEAFRQELQRNIILFLKLFPSIAVLSSLVQGLVLLLAVAMIFPALGLSRPWFGRFQRWRLPVPFVWILLAGMAVVIVNTQRPLPPAVAIAGLNVIFFAGVLYWVQGVAVGRHFLKQGPVWLWFLTLLAAVLFPQPVAALGVFDALYDFRSRSFAFPSTKGKDD